MNFYTDDEKISRICKLSFNVERVCIMEKIVLSCLEEEEKREMNQSSVFSNLQTNTEWLMDFFYFLFYSNKTSQLFLNPHWLKKKLTNWRKQKDIDLSSFVNFSETWKTIRSKHGQSMRNFINNKLVSHFHTVISSFCCQVTKISIENHGNVRHRE